VYTTGADEMAKLGEGDARWIVKERDDGQNVNGWHWSEKNLYDWANEDLKERLCGIVAIDEGSSKGWCKVISLESMSGEVTVQSRKKKKFPLYELEIVLAWEGQLWDNEGKVVTEAKGKVKIPDLSEETYDDLEMDVTCEDENNEKRPLKEAMRTVGKTRIREACTAFVKKLKADVDAGKDSQMATPAAPPTERFNSQYVTGSAEKTSTKTVSMKYEFSPPPPVIYDTLLDSGRIRGATASDCEISKEVGGKISLFSGAVTGENVELVPFDSSKGEAKIVWKWRFSTWQPSHYSTVTITIADKNGNSKLELVQTGVPEEEAERTEKGWKGLLFDRLKAMLGGSVMM